MGEKRVVLEEKNRKTKPVRKKKKKSCCCSCLATFAIVTVVVLAVGVGAGWYFGDKYTRENLDMSLSECFSVVANLYAPDEKKIVTNGYTDSDLNGFYSDLKKALFLNDSADVDVDTIYELITDSTPKSFSRAATGEGSGGEVEGTEGEEGEKENVLMKYIAALFTKENVDLTRLKAYDESNHEDYLLTIKDKGLAAFVDKLLGKMLSEGFVSADASPDGSGEQTPDFTQSLKEYGIDNLGDFVSLRQIILSREQRDVTVTDENGDMSKERKEVTMISLTVQIKLADAIKPVLETYNAGAAHFAVKALLPNNLFLTLGMGLDAETEIDIRINRIDNEKKLNSAIKLIDGIMKSADGFNGVRQTLSELSAKNIRPILDKITEVADLSHVENGALSMDAFESVISFAKINEGAEEGDKVTGKELLTTLKNVCTSEYENAINPEYTFNNQYVGDAGDPNYNAVYGTVYKPADISGKTLVDYKDEFLKEVAAKYLINLDPDGKPNSGDEIDFEDFMALFGIGESNKVGDITALIDASRMEELLGEEDAEKLKIVINDRMMGAIVSETLGSVLGGSEFNSYDIRAEQLALRKESIDGAGDVRQFLELGVSIGLSSFTSAAGGDIGSIVSSFLPERIMITAVVDITRGVSEQARVKTQIRYNDLSAQQTDKTLKVIGKFVESLSIDSVVEQLETPLRQTLDSMYAALDTIEFSTSKVLLPDMFTVISDTVFKDEGGNRVVEPEEIKNMLKKLTGSDENGYLTDKLGISEAAQDYSNFTNEIKDKYYLKVGEFTDFGSIFDIVDINNFDSDRFDIAKMKEDGRKASELAPVISERELAKIFAEAMGESTDLGTIAGIKIGSGANGRYIRLAAEISLDSFGESISSLLPVKKVFVVATCYVDEKNATGDGYRTEITVNLMGEDEKQTLQKMLDHLSGSGALNLGEKADELGKAVYDSFKTLSDSLGEDGYEFTDGGIKLTDFYSFLAKATNIDTANTDYGENKAQVIENMKGAVQGLYERGEGNNPANFAENEIITNAAVAFDKTQIAESFEEMPSAANGFTGRMSDRRFAGYIAGQFAEKNAALKELTVITSGYALAQSYYDELSAMGGVVDTAKNYMRLVVEVDFSKISGGDNSANTIGAMLPAKIYVTLYVDLSDMTAAASIKINSLSTEQQAVLFAMAGMSGDGAAIANTVQESLDILSQYENATFKVAEAASDAVGAIETKFDFTDL